MIPNRIEFVFTATVNGSVKFVAWKSERQKNELKMLQYWIGLVQALQILTV